MINVNAILYNNFETLDVFGPIEVLGRLKDNFKIGFYSKESGAVLSSQNAPVLTESFDRMNAEGGILFIPGGDGIKSLVQNTEYINFLKESALKSSYILTVCTGSILLSRTGLLNGRKATSNKRLFKMTSLASSEVNWVKKARWVKDGNIYTSSGISAGIDMALGFIADLLGYETAKQQSVEIEYDWKEDKDWDPFSAVYNL